jgi:chromosome segregation ATPase
VSSSETGDDRGGGVLSGLLAPLRLPERVVGAADAVTRALEHLGPIREEIVRVRRQTQPLSELLPALEDLKSELVVRLDGLHEVISRLEGSDSNLNQSVRELGKQVTAMHETLSGLQDDLQRITDRMPDGEAAGPLAKARDFITGSE